MIFGINTTSDISKLLYVISRTVRRVKFETILKYHEWYLCQISRTNHAIICLYYYPQKVCNFHMQVFQIKLKYHWSKPIKLQKFVMKGSICPSSQLVKLLMAGQVPIWNFYRTRIRVFFIAELFAG